MTIGMAARMVRPIDHAAAPSRAGARRVVRTWWPVPELPRNGSAAYDRLRVSHSVPCSVSVTPRWSFEPRFNLCSPTINI